MAWSFDGTNDYLVTASNIDLTAVNIVSVAFWLYWDAFADDNDAALELSTNGNLVTTAFVVLPNGGSGGFHISLLGDVGYSNANYTRPSAAEWHPYVAIFDKSLATNEVDLYIDGTLQTPLNRTNNNNTNNFGNLPLYFMSRGGASLFGAGDMAELVIYPGQRLNANEAMALARGVSPLKIRPTSNPYYWPLWGVHNNEICLRSGGPSLTVSGAVRANHAPVAPFSQRFWALSMSEIAAAAARRRLLLGVGR